MATPTPTTTPDMTVAELAQMMQSSLGCFAHRVDAIEKAVQASHDASTKALGDAKADLEKQMAVLSDAFQKLSFRVQTLEGASVATPSAPIVPNVPSDARMKDSRPRTLGQQNSDTANPPPFQEAIGICSPQ